MKQLLDIAPYVALDDLTLREALVRLNQMDRPFLLVVDTERKLLGTVTDGDIRRAMIRGTQLEDPLSDCMHREPVTLRDDVTDVESSLRKVPFVPVLDQRGQVTSVMLRDSSEILVRDAVVMAGGLGTRLGAITKQVPKPLLPVADRPILDHVLANLEAAGVERIWITVNHLAEQIEQFAVGREGPAKLEILCEDQRLGTAGALGLVTDAPTQPFLVVNGDVLTDVDFQAMSAFHSRHDYDGTIAVAYHQVQVPFGVVSHDGGVFSGIDEKPVLRHFVAAGIYLFSPEVLNLVPGNQPMDMPHLLNEARSIGLRMGLFPIHEYWTDVGRPEDLSAADAHHRRGD
jgi:dTDP-glucose pyrophosphorylase